MTTITRRTFLRVVPGAAAATAIPLGLVGGAVIANEVALAPAEHPSQAMRDAIKQHRCAMAAFESTCSATDELDPHYEGAKGWARWRKSNNAEQAAFRKLLKLKPQTIADVRAKARYLRGKNIDLAGQRDGIALLLASLAN